LVSWLRETYRKEGIGYVLDLDRMACIACSFDRAAAALYIELHCIAYKTIETFCIPNWIDSQI
jgi:hypothetical protein